MGKIGIEHLCKGCMSFLQYTDRPCPKCGFDEKWFYSGKEFLKVASILNERYLVGKVLTQNDYEIIYIGWDLEANCKVTIRECYLKDFLKRDSTVSNEVILTDESKRSYFDTFIFNYTEEARRLHNLGNLFGVIWIFDAIMTNGTSYVITEYIEYVTLDDYMEKQAGRISIYEILSYLQPVIYSLATLHENGIVHGNINLQNIVVNTVNGDVVLIGFGINQKLTGAHSYLDDIQGICQIMYKVICGPRYLNNMTCFVETGKLMIPNNVEAFIANVITRGMSSDINMCYINIGELYDEIYNNEQFQQDLQSIGMMHNINSISQPYINNGLTASAAQYETYQYGLNSVQNEFENALRIGDNSNGGIKRFLSNKKILLTVVAATTILVIVLCQLLIWEDKISPGGGSSSYASEGEAIVWKDKAIEEAVRREISKEDGSAIYEEDLDSIQMLLIRNKGVKSLEDLVHFNNLTRLVANNNDISDISPLESMTKLIEINLASNNIKSIDVISKLTRLTTIDLSDNDISTIADLEELTALSNLNLNNNNITSVSNISRLSGIKQLSLASNKIDDVSPLAGLKEISRLDLASNNIKDWSPIKDIERVNGRSYKLNVQFCYQRSDLDYDKWRLRVWNSKIVNGNLASAPALYQFESSTEKSKSSKVIFSLNMVEDNFGYVIQNKEDASIKDIEKDRYINIENTEGEVNIKVYVYSGTVDADIFYE